jgi:hypothetical protein
MGDSPDFEKGQLVGARLTGASVTITAMLGVSRATVSKVTSGCMNHGKSTSAKRNGGAKINTDRKGSSYIEKDCFEKSQNYCSAGNRTAYSASKNAPFP